MSCPNDIKSEFSVTKFGLSNEKPSLFVAAQVTFLVYIFFSEFSQIYLQSKI